MRPHLKYYVLFLARHDKKDMDTLEKVQDREGEEIGASDQKAESCDGVASGGEVLGDLVSVYKYLMGGCKECGAVLFSVPKERGNECKLKQQVPFKYKEKLFICEGG